MDLIQFTHDISRNSNVPIVDIIMGLTDENVIAYELLSSMMHVSDISIDNKKNDTGSVISFNVPCDNIEELVDIVNNLKQSNIIVVSGYKYLVSCTFLNNVFSIFIDKYPEEDSCDIE